jgi:hypothetical protein
MTPKTRTRCWILLSILSLGTAVYLSLLFQSVRYTILDHAFRIAPLSFAVWATAAFLSLTVLWIAVGRFEARATGRPVDAALQKGIPALLPFAFGWCSPLLLSHYVTRGDCRTRLAILGLLILAGFVFLTAARLGRGPSTLRTAMERARDRFGSWPRRKKITVLFLAALLVYNLAAFALVAQGLTFSGDEPNYLITTDSLYYDRDINLADNYAEQDYFHFYSKKDNPRLNLGVYGRAGKAGRDHIYPINLPGISFLMLPYYGLSQLFSGKLLTFILKSSLSVWAALLGVQVFLFAAERWKDERISLTLWGVYSFTCPILFYAIHLYPEVPVAFLGLLIYRKLSAEKPLRTSVYLGLGFLLATFFWFGVKYNLIFWPLLAVAAYHIWRTPGARRKLAAFAVFPVISTVLFYLYVYSLYGTFSPFAIYEGVTTAEQFQAWKRMVIAIPLRQRIDAFLDYFLDQRDGLLLYAPFYLLSFAGFVAMFRKAKREWITLCFIALPFVLNYGFFTHRQGYSPQGRVLTPVSWIAVIALGYFLAGNRKPFFAGAFRLFVFAGLAIALVLLFHPLFLYQPTTHEFTERAGDLFVFLGNMHVFLPPLLPSFIKVDNARYAPNYIWIAALLAFVFSYILIRNKRDAGPSVRALGVLALLGGGFFLWALYPRDSLYPVKVIDYSETRALGFHTASMGQGVVVKPNGDLYLHYPKTYRVIFSSRRKLEQVRLSYGSAKGEYGIAARLFDLPLFEDRTILQTKESVFSPPAYYRIKGLYIYEIDLDIRKYSPENMRSDPFFLSITPLK